MVGTTEWGVSWSVSTSCQQGSDAAALLGMQFANPFLEKSYAPNEMRQVADSQRRAHVIKHPPAVSDICFSTAGSSLKSVTQPPSPCSFLLSLAITQSPNSIRPWHLIKISLLKLDPEPPRWDEQWSGQSWFTALGVMLSLLQTVATVKLERRRLQEQSGLSVPKFKRDWCCFAHLLVVMKLAFLLCTTSLKLTETDQDWLEVF